MEPWWIPVFREVFTGRRVVIAGGAAAAWGAHVDLLRSVGVADLLVVATEGRGAGPVPDVPTVIVEPPAGAHVMDRIRFSISALEDPPGDVVDAVARFDPGGEALVVGSFLNTATHLAGRPFLASRRPQWVALEDKVVVDAFWDRAGVDRQPSVIVPLDAADDAAAELDRGAGTVWAADARDGFHGGGEQTYWITGDTARSRASAALREVCDTVRVMPFIDGVPCSIHGIVLPDGVAVLRPVEMVVLRRGSSFVYAGCATFWDPPAGVRDQMRQVARRAGEQLGAEVDFRGSFTVDGVAAVDGFWPTELNPRFGGGIMTIARASGLPILLLNDVIVSGHPIRRDVAELERELVARADAQRGGGTWIGGLQADLDSVDRDVVTGADGRWDWADPDVFPGGHVIGGGQFVRCTYEPATTPVGPPTAALAAAFWEFADRELETAVGPLTPAPDPFET